MGFEKKDIIFGLGLAIMSTVCTTTFDPTTAVITAIGCAIASYFYFFNQYKEENNFSEAPLLETNDPVIKSLRKKFENEKPDQDLSKELILAIHSYVADICNPEYIKLQTKTRESRREVHSEATRQQYTEDILSSEKKTEEMVIMFTEAVVNECGISFQKFEDSRNNWFSIDHEFTLVLMSQMEKMREIKSSKNCTKEKSIEIIDYQIEVYDSIPFNKDIDVEKAIVIKNYWICDMIYEKFGIEQEDYISNPEIVSNAEFINKLDKLSKMMQAEFKMNGGTM